MLKTKQIGDYTVSQMGPLQSARMRMNLKQASEIKDEAERMAADEWAMIAACAEPSIPFEQYVTMPYMDIRPLVEAVEELNAEMAQLADAEDYKKKVA